MITYKDITFCTGAGCKHSGSCEIVLTDKVREDAKKWWGSDDPPISYMHPSSALPCFDPEVVDAIKK